MEASVVYEIIGSMTCVHYARDIWKKVGLFEHYLDATGAFQPRLELAKRYSSKQMADIMAKKHGGLVREVRDNLS